MAILAFKVAAVVFYQVPKLEFFVVSKVDAFSEISNTTGISIFLFRTYKLGLTSRCFVDYTITSLSLAGFNKLWIFYSLMIMEVGLPSFTLK